jgi:hypothetical protein
MSKKKLIHRFLWGVAAGLILALILIGIFHPSNPHYNYHIKLGDDSTYLYSPDGKLIGGEPNCRPGIGQIICADNY